MSYIRKRQTYEAIRVADALASSASEPAWLQAQLTAGAIRLLPGAIEVTTTQGALAALPDDYVMLDNTTGKLSIITGERFESMYEAL